MKMLTDYRNKSRLSRILTIAAFTVTPAVCCVLLMLVSGVGPRSVELLCGTSNDEVAYYAQIAGIREYGMPLGYFGYNESQAMFGTLSTWGPVPLLAFILWAVCFGWNSYSAVLCNISLLSLSMGLFAVLVKPRLMQSVLFIGMYAVAVFISWRAFLIMPEALNYALLILFAGLSFSLSHTSRHDTAKIVAAFAIIVFLSLMRPYYMVLLLLPGYDWARRRQPGKRTPAVVISCLIILGTLCGYVLILHYFSAPYFQPIVQFSLFMSIPALFNNFYSNLLRFLIDLKTSLANPANANFAGFIAMVILLGVQVCLEFKRKNTDSFIRFGIIFAFSILMWGSSLTLVEYIGVEKHLAEIVLLGMFVLGQKANVPIKASCFIVLCVLYLFNLPHFSLRKKDVEQQRLIDTARESLHASITLNESADPWDNTVIWVLADEFGGTWWRGLCSLPDGMGLNLCLDTYVEDNWGNLKSKYLYASVGGEIDKLCEESGAILVHDYAEYGVTRLWQLR